VKLVGRTDIGATAVEMAADTKRVARFNVPEAGNVAKATFYLDGLGSGGLGAQVCRAIIYDKLDNLLAQSDEVSIPLGMPGAWVDFAFSKLKGGLGLSVGDLFLGLHCGGYTNTVRVRGSGPHGMGGKFNSDTYSDGAASSFGAATATTSDLSAFLSMFHSYETNPPDETDLYFSRLPFQDAQKLLGVGGPVGARVALTGWHDTFTDPETGSNALVRDTGPLASLLGERIKITTYGQQVNRSVYAFVHGVVPADFGWDISLSRHLFGQIAPLATDTVNTKVEVLT
jgi:hypothetical protein